MTADLWPCIDAGTHPGLPSTLHQVPDDDDDDDDPPGRTGDIEPPDDDDYGDDDEDDDDEGDTLWTAARRANHV